MPKGYTDSARLSVYLNRELDANQLAQADLLLSAVEDKIDQLAGREWWTAAGSPPPQTVAGEIHYPTGRIVFLQNRPVAAVTSVTARNFSVGSAVTALVAGADYELIDAASGLVLLSADHAGEMLTFAYSVGNLPDAIRSAATLLLAHWMRPTLDPQSFGNRNYGLGGEVTVTVDEHDIPPEVFQMLSAHADRRAFA